MTQEEKQLLLPYLCAALPYEVICKSNSYRNILFNSSHISLIESEEIKPYLRPMSSMTEKEKKQFDKFMCIDEDAWMGNGIKGYINQSIIMSNAIQWLLKNHFDFMGLIPKGLALEAPEGMYEKGE